MFLSSLDVGDDTTVSQVSYESSVNMFLIFFGSYVTHLSPLLYSLGVRSCCGYCGNADSDGDGQWMRGSRRMHVHAKVSCLPT